MLELTVQRINSDSNFAYGLVEVFHDQNVAEIVFERLSSKFEYWLVNYDYFTVFLLRIDHGPARHSSC